MTFPEMRSRQRSRGSWAAAGSGRLFVVLALVAGGCSSTPTASATPTPSSSPVVASSSPAPSSVNGETPVPQQVLAPAPDLPVANLCSAQLTTTADGNATPLLCSTGAVNVQAWRFYASVSASVLGIGLNPTQGQVENAMCDDIAHNHASRPEEANGYKLAATYYGWSFNLDPATVTCS